MRIDYILKAVITAEHITKAHRKNLTQTERRLLMQCFEAIKDSNKAESLILKKRKIKHLISKLESGNQKAGSSCFLVAIFKRLFNILHFRIGIDRLDKELHKVYEESFSRHPYAESYGKMLKEVLNDPFQSQSQRSAVYKVVTGFYSLALHYPKINHLDRYSQSVLIKNRTGLSIDPNEGQKFNEIVENAPAKLKEVFESVDRLSLHNSFFGQAFNPEDKTIRDCLERIENYSKKFREDLKKGNVDHKPLHQDEEELLKLLKEGEKNAQKPEPIDEPFVPRELDKDETLFGMYQTFLEKKFSEFAKIKNYAYEKASFDTREKLKKDMMADLSFYNDYANTENFEKYAISERVFNQKCKNGYITLVELKNKIQVWANIDMLGEKPIPVIKPPLNQQFVVKPPVIVNNPQLLFNPIPNNPQLHGNLNNLKPQMQGVVKQEPVKIDGTQYLDPKPTPEMEKKFPEIQTFKEMFIDLKSNIPFTHRAKETLGALYKLYIHQENVLKWHEGTPEGNVVHCPWIGLVLHFEERIDGAGKKWTKKDTRNVLEASSTILLNAYKKHKKENKLGDLFNCLEKRGTAPCLEGRMADLDAYLDESNMRDDAPSLEARLLLLIPKLNAKEDKAQHNNRMVEAFVELQARKYAKDNNIVIDESWFKENGTRAKVKGRYGFYRYCNKANYIKFLEEEVKIYEGKTKEGPFTKADVEKFAEYNVSTGVFDDVTEKPIPAANSLDTKQENFERLLEVFIDLQARKYAKINKIKIEDDWLLEEGSKEKILLKDDFKEKFYTKENLIEFFAKKVKIKTTSDGKITEDDINAFAEKIFKEKKVAPVNSKETKQENLNRLLDLFIDLQARKFAAENNLKIDATWLDKEGIKEKILLNEDFRKKFNTQKNLLEFLTKEAKIIDRDSSEGKFTEGDVNAFIAKIFKEKDIVPINLQKTKQENLDEILKTFIDLQARKYAGENNIEIDASWSDKEGSKEKILLKEDFREKFNTKENFLEFLTNDAKIVDKDSAEGKITNDDVSAFVEKTFK